MASSPPEEAKVAAVNMGCHVTTKGCCCFVTVVADSFLLFHGCDWDSDQLARRSAVQSGLRLLWLPFSRDVVVVVIVVVVVVLLVIVVVVLRRQNLWKPGGHGKTINIQTKMQNKSVLGMQNKPETTHTNT
jgi:hypothetical protein